MIHLQKDERIELWTQLTDLCKAHDEFSYHYLKAKKYPFEYKGWSFRKIKPNDQ